MKVKIIKKKIQGKPKKSDFFSRNSAGQKRVTLYIYSCKEENLYSRILYQVRLSFRFKGEIKTSSDKSYQNSAPPNQHCNKS